MTDIQDVSPERNERNTLDVDKISAESAASKSSHHDIEDKKIDLEHKRMEGDLQASMQSQAQGALGKILGDRDHAPTYAVAISLLLLVLVSAGLAFMRYEDTIGFVDLAKGVIIAALGYFAGARSERRKVPG